MSAASVQKFLAERQYHWTSCFHLSTCTRYPSVRGAGWECMGRGEWEGIHIIIIVVIISSQWVHSAPRGKRCCWSGRWSQCRLATRTAGRWHKRKPRRRSGASRRTRSCWRPSPRAAASGESCERPARSMRDKGGWEWEEVGWEVRSRGWVEKGDDGPTVYQFQKVSYWSEHPQTAELWLFEMSEFLHI